MPILICYDGSDSAKRALRAAARTLGHERAVLLNVWNPPAPIIADAFGVDNGSLGPPTQELERLAVERGEQIAQEGRELAGELGLAVDTRVEESKASVWQTILEIADEADAALIVIGTHGVTAVQTALLGSVSNAVVHHSKRPVLVVPANDS